MPHPASRPALFGLVGILAVSACSDGTTAVLAPGETAPEDTGDGWSVAALEQVGIDGARIETLERRIGLGSYDHVHGLAIVRHGHLVRESYYRDHGRDSLHTLQSVTKSVGATLIGIAVDRGLLSLDQTLPEMLPDRADLLALDPAKSEIRLRHLLSMQAGLQWDEWTCAYQDTLCNSNGQMNQSDDWVGFVLRQPMADAPGERFVYNSGASNLLAAILRNATGQDPVRFARENLFEPLAIEKYGWYRNVDHVDSLPHFGGGLRLRTRDLAKIGQLYLDRGVWNGRRVLSPEWIDRTGTARARVSTRDHYGFQWWLRALDRPGGPEGTPGDIVFGWGYGGQHVFVIASLDLVVAINSWNEDGHTTAFDVLDEVLRAVRDF